MKGKIGGAWRNGAVLTGLPRYGDMSDADSFMTSVLSSVRRGVEENGRIYPSYGRHEYGMPVDEKELDRMDLQHHKFTLMLNDKLFIAPIDESRLQQASSRVLDIGTGSGIWAIVRKRPRVVQFCTDHA